MAKWYQKITEGIQPARQKKSGKGRKCPDCGTYSDINLLENNLFVCKCGHHFRLDTNYYLDIFFDDDTEVEYLFEDIKSKDFLKFEDTIPYTDRLKEAQNKTGLSEAAIIAKGKSSGRNILIAALDFNFIAGSMGSVVGERIAKAIEYSIEHKIPFLTIAKSGGARLMESVFSLLQMAKINAKLACLSEHRIPFISLLTDPTTGGVMASFAMLGDINIAEPNAHIGYAGPKVVRETIGRDLPKGFQRSEFLLKHGFLDMIVKRHELKEKLDLILSHICCQAVK
jgi:acetyl-CoA carboxylase carboxyl transferase subunit beta